MARNSPSYFQKIKKFLIAGVSIGFLIIGGFLMVEYGQKSFSIPKTEEEIFPNPASYPKNFTGLPPPDFTAKSVIVMDVNSGVILLEKNSQTPVKPASTTKIMSALVALEHYKLSEVIEVGDIGKIEGQKMNLLPGEKITAESLLYGLLVASANDAALVLAKNFPAGLPGFVWAMNQKAYLLKLENSHFTNPVGYDEEDHYSTALDLAKLAVYAMENQEFVKIVGTKKITIFDISGTISHRLTNINFLVGKLPGVKGVKTGWTQQAGECLVTFVEQEGKKIVTVVLGSQDRFKETEKLINWIFDNFIWEDFNLSPE